MISHEYKCVFVHNRRTGGTSIEKCLHMWTPHMEQHTPAQMFFDALGKDQWYKYFKFTIVRNPWCRAISAYLWRRKQGKHYARSLSFPKWVQTNYQDETMCDLLRTRNAIEMDFFGRFERLEKDYRHVRQVLGLRPARLRPPREHGTFEQRKDRHYSELYDNAARQYVAERFAEDIERFAYVFEG